jgi:hypothetical protein
MDVFPAQEIIEHANLTSQDLTQFGTEAVEGFYFHQGPDQQGTEQVGQRLPAGAALAADGCTEQSGQRVTLEAIGEFRIGEGEGLFERIGQRGIGTGAAARALGFGLGRGGFNAGVRHMTVYIPSY